MGYPFTARMRVGGRTYDPMDALRRLRNCSTSEFIIRNRDTRWGEPPVPTPPPTPPHRDLAPDVQVGDKKAMF